MKPAAGSPHAMSRSASPLNKRLKAGCIIRNATQSLTAKSFTSTVGIVRTTTAHSVTSLGAAAIALTLTTSLKMTYVMRPLTASSSTTTSGSVAGQSQGSLIAPMTTQGASTRPAARTPTHALAAPLRAAAAQGPSRRHALDMAIAAFQKLDWRWRLSAPNLIARPRCIMAFKRSTIVQMALSPASLGRSRTAGEYVKRPASSTMVSVM